jgi:hypothetical protein
MTPPTVQVSVSYGPASAGQMAAWKRLFGLLLARERPTPAGKAEAGHDEIAQASAHGGCEYDTRD